jgi:hypothetical protein
MKKKKINIDGGLSLLICILTPIGRYHALLLYKNLKKDFCFVLFTLNEKL